MKFFLTGGTGFLGRRVLAEALSRGHSAVGLFRGSAPPSVEGVWYRGDLENIPRNAFVGCEVFIHLAAHGVSPKATTWDEGLRWNVLAFAKLLQQAYLEGVDRVLACGTCFEYGRAAGAFERIPPSAPLDPIGTYAVSKAAASLLFGDFLSEKRWKGTLVRPFNMYGDGAPPGTLWRTLADAAQKGGDVPLTDGRQIRDFMNVSEAATAIVNIAENTELNPGVVRKLNLGSGVAVSVREFVESQWRILGGHGELLFGAVDKSKHEIGRYVPDISETLKFLK
jgi:nucleoside-diphosphate-sugar epimerase